MKAIFVLSTLAVTGLVIVFGNVGEAAADVAVGLGPTYYTVQPQPAPGACRYLTAANGQTLPDPNCTPGAISPKLATTICRTGYTKSIRPPASITEIEKRDNAAAYGYTGSLKDVEYEHLSCHLNLAGTRTILATCGSKIVRRSWAPMTRTSSRVSSVWAVARGARRAGSGAHQLSAERARLESIVHAAHEYADHDLCSRFDDFMA